MNDSKNRVYIYLHTATTQETESLMLMVAWPIDLVRNFSVSFGQFLSVGEKRQFGMQSWSPSASQS